MKINIVFIIQVLLTTFCLAAGSSIPRGYHVLKEISLTQGLGAEGTIQLLVDRRINEKTDLDTTPENARNGILRLLGPNGSETSRKLLKKPRVDIELMKGNVGHNIFLFVTEDWSIEFGSYNGPISALYTLKGNRLAEVKPKMVLMRSLKTEWTVKERGRGGLPEIFEVKCRPDFNSSIADMKFKITYSHFLLDGARWKLRKREVPGFWESESKFPSEELFP